MTELTFVTTNKNKFFDAQHVFGNAGITVTQAIHEIDEIQGEDAETIARDKAQKAYNLLQKPVLTTDDSWAYPGLGGFPGPYMKSINHWFTPEDLLRLTLPLKDRRVILTQTAVYQDQHGQKVFKREITGRLLSAVSPYPGVPNMKVISLTADGRSLAEVRATTPKQLTKELDVVWADIAAWVKTHQYPTPNKV